MKVQGFRMLAVKFLHVFYFTTLIRLSKTPTVSWRFR
jgi:hypothetical protein